MSKFILKLLVLLAVVVIAILVLAYVFKVGFAIAIIAWAKNLVHL